jgi:hypothetical protein
MTLDRDLGLTIDHPSIWRPLFGIADQTSPVCSTPVVGLQSTLEEQGAVAAFVILGSQGSGPLAWAAIHVVQSDHPVRERQLRRALVTSSTCLMPPSVTSIRTPLGNAHRIEAVRLVPLQGLSRPVAVGQVTWTWLHENESIRIVLITEAPFPHPFSEVVALMDELAKGLSWRPTNDLQSDTTTQEEAP